MMADLADEHELASGHRREGMLFGVINFSSALTPVVGIWIASDVLAWVGLPRRADPASVDPAMLHELGWIYGPLVFALIVLSAWLMSRYSLSRERLLEIQRMLRIRPS